MPSFSTALIASLVIWSASMSLSLSSWISTS